MKCVKIKQKVGKNKRIKRCTVPEATIGTFSDVQFELTRTCIRYAASVNDEFNTANSQTICLFSGTMSW